MFKKKLSLKLIASFSLLILVLFLVSGYATYKVYVRLFTSEISKQFTKATEQAAARVGVQIQDIYRATNYIVFHPYIEEILRRSAERSDNNAYKRMLDQSELTGLLNQITIDEPRLTGMYVYDMNDTGYFFENSSATVIPMREDLFADIMAALKGSNGELVWLPMRIPSINSAGFKDVITAARYMKNKKQEQYGTLILFYDESIFGGILDELTKGDSAAVYLQDDKGTVIYSNRTDADTARVELASADGTGLAGVGQKSVFIGRSRVPQTGLAVTSGLSLQSLNSRSKVIFQIALASAAASVVFASLLIFFTGRRLLRPLYTLVTGMTRLRSGRFDTRIRISTQDELAFLGQSFNEMAEKIEALIREVYVRRLNEREAELTALQAQLNPHFLYNTLDTLYMKMVLGENDEQAAELVLSLSGLLRYALQSPGTPTTLGDEMEHIRKYIRIQIARIGGRLETFLTLDEDAAQLPVPRLILQPLVENAFVHAFSKMNKVCILRIKAALERHPHGGPERALIIEVTDNGAGIPPEQLKKLELLQREKPEEPEESGRGIGLRTVIRRISLLYGPPYRLDIESHPDSGTTMRLVLPAEDQAASSQTSEAARKEGHDHERKADDSGR